MIMLLFEAVNSKLLLLGEGVSKFIQFLSALLSVPPK